MMNNFKPASILSSRLLQGLIVPLLLVALWEYASRQSDALSYALAPIDDIRLGLIEVTGSGELVMNLLATLKTSMTGLFIGGLAGVTIGGLMGLSRTFDRIVGPIYHTIRQVPILGWIPLIGLWFGNGLFSKSLIVSLASFYPLVLNTYEGVRNADRQHLEVAQALRFNRWQLFFNVLLPGALPSVMTGVAQALAFSWIATVGTELLFVAGPGIGGLMQTAQAAARMDIVVICVLSIGVTGLAMNHGLQRLSANLLRWRNTR